MNETRDLNEILLDILNQSNKDKYIQEIIPKVKELDENQVHKLLLALEDNTSFNTDELYFRLFSQNKYVMHIDYQNKIENIIPMKIFDKVFDYYYNDFPNSNLALNVFQNDLIIDPAITYYVFKKTNNEELKDFIKKTNEYDIVRIFDENIESEQLIDSNLIFNTINELNENYIGKEDTYEDQLSNYLETIDKSNFTDKDKLIHKQKIDIVYSLSMNLISELNKGTIKLSNDELKNLTIDNSIKLLIDTDSKYDEVYSRSKYSSSKVLDDIYNRYSNIESKDSNRILHNVARNKNTNLNTLYKIYDNENNHIRSALVDNPNVSRSLLNSLIKEFPDYYSSPMLANNLKSGNRITTSEKASDLLNKDYNNLKIENFQHFQLLVPYPDHIPYKEYDNELIRKENNRLCKSIFDLKDTNLNIKLASNPNTPTDILFLLSKENNVSIINALMKNPVALKDFAILNSIKVSHPKLIVSNKAIKLLENIHNIKDKEIYFYTKDEINTLQENIEKQNNINGKFNSNIESFVNKMKEKFYQYKSNFGNIKNMINELNSNTNKVSYEIRYEKDDFKLDKHDVLIIKEKSVYDIKYKEYESFTLIDSINVDHDKSIYERKRFNNFNDVNVFLNKELEQLNTDTKYKRISAEDVNKVFNLSNLNDQMINLNSKFEVLDTNSSNHKHK